MSIPEKFSAGGLFPQYTWASVNGDEVTLSIVEGWKLLVIYRGKHCPLCNHYLAGLEKLKAEYEASGITVWALSADPIERARECKMAQGWTFPVLAGLGEDQMRALGLYMSVPRSPNETDRNFAEPAIFVINPDNRVQIIDLSNAPFSRPDLQALLNGLRYVVANDYPVRGTAD